MIQTDETEPARTRRAHLYERRRSGWQVHLAASAPMSGILDLAHAHGVEDITMLTDGMRNAPAAAAAFLEEILATYADHTEFALKVSRVPDLRINDKHTGRVLLTLTWQVRNEAFACTALAAPSALESGAFDDLRAWNGKPHQSAFHLDAGPDDMRRLTLALEASATVLEG